MKRSRSRALHTVTFPETAGEGYFVHARYGDEQLHAPAAGEFYIEIETALALGLCWVNDRHTIDPETLLVSGIRKGNQELAMAFRFRGLPRCGVLIAWSDFEAPHREKLLKLPNRWWQRFVFWNVR